MCGTFEVVKAIEYSFSSLYALSVCVHCMEDTHLFSLGSNSAILIVMEELLYAFPGFFLIN